MKLRPLKAALGLALVAAMSAGMLAPAQAVILMEKVWIVCGPNCLGAMARREVERMQEFDDLANMARSAYQRDGQTQWQLLNDDPYGFNVATALDLRCNTSIAHVVGGTNASSTLNVQKTGAETAWNMSKAAMSPTQFTAFVNGLGPESGSYSVPGMGNFTNLKVAAVIWENGTASYFTVVQSSSGWVIGQHVGYNSGTPHVVCPA